MPQPKRCIENYRSLREELQVEGVVFLSDTDTEVIPHLLSRVAAAAWVYALAVVWAKMPGALVVARKAAPLVRGGAAHPVGIELYDAAGERVQRSPSLLSGTERSLLGELPLALLSAAAGTIRWPADGR